MDQNSLDEMRAEVTVLWRVVTTMAASLPIKDREDLLAGLESFRRLSAEGSDVFPSPRMKAASSLLQEVLDRFIREVPGPARGRPG